MNNIHNRCITRHICILYVNEYRVETLYNLQVSGDETQEVAESPARVAGQGRRVNKYKNQLIKLMSRLDNLVKPEELDGLLSIQVDSKVRNVVWLELTVILQQHLPCLQYARIYFNDVAEKEWKNTDIKPYFKTTQRA